MSDITEEVTKEVETVTEKVVAEEAKPAPVAEVKVSETEEQSPAAPAAEEVKAVEAEKPAEVAPVEKKVEKVEEEVAAPAPVEVPVTETVEKVVDQFENMTIFGNKSLDELHKIQSKKSHLSAGTIDFALWLDCMHELTNKLFTFAIFTGILFTDPSLRM